MASSFLQSQEWQTFQQAVGRQTFHSSGLLFIRMPLPFKKSYLYCPRFVAKDDLANIFQKIKKTVIDSDIFVRLEPMSGVRCQVSGVRCYKCPPTQPKQTVLLDLSKSDDELLAEMKPKTRYNIRLAEKHNVKCQMSNVKCFDLIWQLMQETSTRDRFSTHNKAYYSTMLEVLGKHKMAHLLTANYKKDLLAAMILITYKDQAIYLHGASSNQKRNLMAPYLLHWDAIQFAKSRGCKTYDFWGINVKRISNMEYGISKEKIRHSTFDIRHSTDGVTRFKLSFGGHIVEYPNSFEIPLRPLEYSGYRMIRKIDRFIKLRTFQ